MNVLSALRFVLAATALHASVAVQAAPAYKAAVDFNRPGFNSTLPWAINDQGTIVGQSDGVGFIYSGGAFTSLSRAGWDTTSLVGITANGTLVGTSRRQNPDQTFSLDSFIYSGGSFTSFAVAGATDTTIRGISGSGRYIAGTYNGAVGGFVHDLDLGVTRLIADSSYGTVILQGVNDSGIAAGNRFQSLPAGGLARLGFTVDMATGALSDLVGPGVPAGLYPRGINNDGLVTGVASGRAFVGSFADGWLLDMAPLPPGTTAAFGYGVNTAGTVVGYYQTSAGVQRGWIATPVPEPATWALFALGAAAVGAVARRRA